MTRKEAFLPYEPLDELKPVAPDIWTVDGPEIRMSIAGLKLPFPTRMTVVRLADRSLWVHSPIAPTEGLLAQLRRLGRVSFLVAPNSLHYWWLPDWRTAFPDAAAWGVPGLAARARRPLAIDYELGDAAPLSWARDLDQVLVTGSILTEADFFHRASRTLILTDLIENFELARIRNPLLRGIVRISGAADPDGKSPIDMQLSFRRQRPQLRAAVERMLAWAPERIIIAHGRCYEEAGTEELRRAFRWVL